MNLFCKVVNQNSHQETQKPEHCEGISPNDEARLTNVEYKSQAYASFYTTSMEKDKTLLTLSVGGIGFLVTLLNLAKSLNLGHIGLFFIASFAFVVSIHTILTIFGENKAYIIAISQEQPLDYLEKRLTELDKRAVSAFYIGLALTICLGVATSWTLINKGELSMTDNNEKITQTVQNVDALKAPILVDAEKSVGGARTMAPKQPASSDNTSSSPSAVGAAAMKPPKPTEDK